MASNGREALEKAHSVRDVDLLITDVTMPEMDGIALAERIRESIPGLPILFMSGYPETEQVRSPVWTRDNYIQKPVSLQELCERIQNLLRTGGSCNS
ncbi:MAG: response regulator [Pseudomonadota bacterium]